MSNFVSFLKVPGVKSAIVTILLGIIFGIAEIVLMTRTNNVMMLLVEILASTALNVFLIIRYYTKSNRIQHELLNKAKR